MRLFYLFVLGIISCNVHAQYSGPIDYIHAGYGADSIPVTVSNIPNDYFASKDISVFYPTGTSEPIPTVFYLHGYFGNDTTLHSGFLRHIASRGYAVVFVPVKGTIPVEKMYQTLYEGFSKAVANYKGIIDTTRIGFYGHSFGGGATPAVSYYFFAERNWGSNGKFIYCSAPWYSYELGDSVLDNFPADCNMLTVVYDDDETNDHRMGMDIFSNIAIDEERKDFIIVYSDTVENYIYQADHNLPTQYLFKNEFDAFDYYVPFRLLDALADYTFTGNPAAKEMALGNGSASQINMGGQLKPLYLTDRPVAIYPLSKYLFPCDTAINSRNNYCGKFEPSDTITSAITNHVGFQTQNRMVFPNPTDGKININVNNEWSSYEITVFRINGTPVYKSFNRKEIDISNVANGIYVVTVKTSNGAEQRSILRKE